MSVKITQDVNPTSIAQPGDHIEGVNSRDCVYSGIVINAAWTPDGWRYLIKHAQYGKLLVRATWKLTPLPTAPDAPHFTFDEAAERFEQGKGPQRDIVPCVCWIAGHGKDITGLSREQVQHPEEYDEGAQAAYEQAYDL